MSRVADLGPLDEFGLAMADVHRELPEGWYFRMLVYVGPWSIPSRLRRHGPHWRASAARRPDLGLGPAAMVGLGTDATAALKRLAGLLAGVKRPRLDR